MAYPGSPYKTFADGASLPAADLNNSYSTVLNAISPDTCNDYSSNVAQMQTVSDPGESGSESLATTLAGELERLRFCLKELKGTTYWYESLVALKTPDGTAGAPSYSFSSDVNTGLYHLVAADAIGISLGGVQYAQFATSSIYFKGPVTHDDASAAAPSITFNSDPDTGLYRVGANDLGISVGGSQVVDINGSSIIFYTDIKPAADNSKKCGISGQRWSEVWAANGTIQTSHSSTKQNIVDVDPATVPLPRGVEYDRDGRRYLGYLNDDLPVTGRPHGEKGEICLKDNYEQAVIGVLCAHVGKLEKEVADLKLALTN